MSRTALAGAPGAPDMLEAFNNGLAGVLRGRVASEIACGQARLLGRLLQPAEVAIACVRALAIRAWLT